jgi:hypothetical protein
MGADLSVELGNTSTSLVSLGSSTTRNLYGILSGAIRLAADGYGKSAYSGPSIKSYYGSSGQYYQLNSTRLSQISSVRSKFGTKSLLGSTDGGFPSNMAMIVPLNSSDKTNPGSLSGTYTVECWVYMTKGYTAADNYSTPTPLLVAGASVPYNNPWTSDYIVPTQYGVPPNYEAVYTRGGVATSNGQHAYFEWLNNSAPNAIYDTNTADVPLNQWIHTAWTIVNNAQLAVWVNGIRRLYTTSLSGNPLPAMRYLGLNFFSITPTQECYTDEIQVSNIDRYGITNSTITVPSSAFTPDANTMAYINFEN